MGFFDRFVLLLFLFFVSGAAAAATPTAPGDAAGMRALADAIGDGAGGLGWSKSIDPCDWPRVSCSSGRVTAIQVGKRGLAGTLPADLFVNLTALTRLELMENDFSGPLPSLSSLSALQILLLHSNRFSSVPDDIFSGMPSLTAVSIDQNPFERWEISPAIMGATSLVNFSANSANISGTVPKFFATAFPSLNHVALSYNYLAGPIPDEYRSAPVRSLWLNGQNGNPRLSGSIDFIKNLTSIVQLWLQSNSFSGPIPDVSELVDLQDLNLRDNQLTGTVPQSLTSLTSLTKIALTNNLLQGPTPVFSKTVDVDLNPKSESFCLDEPGACDARVSFLLSIVKDFGYPVRFAQGWKGNDPCAGWLGITCDASGNVSVVNFQSMGLQGTISPEFAELPALQQLLLANNNISGVIPDALTKITSLRVLDVSNNSLWGDVPKFRSSVAVNTYGNPNVGKDSDAPGSSDGGGNGGRGGNSTGSVGTDGGGGGRKHSSRLGVIVGSVIGVIVGVFVVGVIIYYICKRDKKKSGGAQYSTAMVIHPQHSGSGSQLLKISVAGPGLNNGSGTNSQTSSTDLHVVESGSMTISIQVLRNVTNNFNADNILGRGGFGTVYKGELHDGTKIAVKRMESGVMGSKGLAEFQAEISVLTKVRHRHLVSLLGYCLDGNEKILVYEHMPQGTLSHHLFHWNDAGLKPLDWKRRLSIALDVARGVEYLHSLAHKSFIHRDLKPSNILLGDDMKAKVADFGLVRLAPEGNNVSVETKLAGTFGYLAPEYAVTGRVTTKADVYSFGVILMELITGRKALDESQPEERVHLVTWFRRVQLNKDTFDKVIDPTIDLDEETFKSIITISEFASHCCAREPYQRPDMGHAVNVLSSLAEIWKPTDTDFDDYYGVDFTMSLSQTLKKWQAFDDSMLMDGASSSFLSNSDNTQTSIPTKPFVTFTSADAR